MIFSLSRCARREHERRLLGPRQRLLGSLNYVRWGRITLAINPWSSLPELAETSSLSLSASASTSLSVSAAMNAVRSRLIASVTPSLWPHGYWYGVIHRMRDKA